MRRWTATKRKLTIGAVVSLLALVAFSTLVLAPPAPGGIVVGPNVIFRPSAAWADISFSTEQRFLTQVVVRPTGLTLDGVSFDVEKLPQGLPRATVTILVWSPAAADGATGISFSASSIANTVLWFNATGLRTDALYDIYVDSQFQSRALAFGTVAFPWSNWSTAHTFDLIVRVTSPSPGDTTPPEAVTDLRASVVGTNFVHLEWTAPGDDGSIGQATRYDVRSSTFGPLDDASFLTGSSVSMTPPGAAGAPELLNVTGLTSDHLYWFALQTADEIPNWSPTSNTVEVLTAFDASNATRLAQSPSVEGVWFDPPNGQLDIIFSQSMNRTSVEQSLAINPDIGFQMAWQNDAHLRVAMANELQSATTYVLRIEPTAADRQGNPISRHFTFQFVGLTPPEPILGGLPLIFAIAMLAGMAVLGEGLILASVIVLRNRRKIRTLQKILLTQARRVWDARARIPGFGTSPVLSHRVRKK